MVCYDFGDCFRSSTVRSTEHPIRVSRVHFINLVKSS